MHVSTPCISSPVPAKIAPSHVNGNHGTRGVPVQEHAELATEPGTGTCVVDPFSQTVLTNAMEIKTTCKVKFVTTAVPMEAPLSVTFVSVRR